jgi:O-antigen/teichoic acid export membrane protein
MSDDPPQTPRQSRRHVRQAAAAISDRPLVKAVLVLFSGDAAAQAVLLLLAPIVTRLYAPDEFGVATVYASFLAIMVVIAALRYEFAIPVPEDDDEAVNVLAAALLASAAMGIVGTVLFLGIARIVEILNDGLPLAVTALFGLSLFFNGALVAIGGWMLRRQDYALLAKARVTRTASQAVLQIGFGWAGWGAMGLIAAALVGTTIGLFTLVTAFLRKDGDQISSVSRARVRASFVRFRRFPIFSGPAAFVQAVNVEIPYVVFGALYARGELGAMGLARRTLGTPLYTLSGAIGQVFFGHGANLVRTAPDELHRFVRRMSLSMGAIFIPLGAVAFVALPPLTTVVFGDDWGDASGFIRVMVPMFVFQAIAAPTGHVLDILERQDLHLIRDLLRLAIGLGAIGVVLFTDPSAVTAMLIYVVFASAGSVLYIMTSLSAIERHRASVKRSDDTD